MKVLIRTAVAALVLGALALTPATAFADHLAGPCNDTDGDGMASGREYAEHHIASFAMAGMLGGGGHIPGSHNGFSACLDVH